MIDGLSDRALVTRALRGDSDAFVTLARRHEGSVCAIAMARLLNTADAEEVTQEVFLRAYERLGELRAPTDSARG